MIDGDSQWRLKISELLGPKLLHSQQTNRKWPSGVQASQTGRRKVQPGPANQKLSFGVQVAKTSRQAHRRSWVIGSLLTSRAAWGPVWCPCWKGYSEVGAGPVPGRWAHGDYAVWTSSTGVSHPPLVAMWREWEGNNEQQLKPARKAPFSTVSLQCPWLAAHNAVLATKEKCLMDSSPSQLSKQWRENSEMKSNKLVTGREYKQRNKPNWVITNEKHSHTESGKKKKKNQHHYFEKVLLLCSLKLKIKS